MTAHVGGQLAPDLPPGSYTRPVVLTGVTNDMRVAREEIFGPVLVIIPFDTNPVGSGYTLQPFYFFGLFYAQPNFNNPTVGYMVRQLYVRQAMQDADDQPGIIKAICRGYGITVSGPVPNSPPGNPWTPPIARTRTTVRARTRSASPRRSPRWRPTAGPRSAG